MNSLEQMYETYKHLLYYISNDILHDSYLAEDAVNTTFLRAAENLSKITEPVCPKTKQFLILVCKRVSIDLYRKQKRETGISLEDIEYEAAANVIIDAEEEDSLQAAITRLPSRYREVILLRYSYGYSVKEISRILNRKEMTVYKTIERGKGQLKEFLQQQREGNDI